MTKAPELRTTQSGTSVCSFTVAVNRRQKQGEEQKTDFFNVTAWRELGELCNKYLAKGRKVLVSGSVSVREWESKGKHGASLEVLAEQVEFLSPKEKDEQSGYEVVEEDDLPFRRN